MPATFGVQPLILVVESDMGPTGSLMSAIASQGFRTLRVPARANAIARSNADASDLVLVDGTHPTLDALWATIRLRERTSTPILVLLSREQEGRRAAVLDAGADDYMVSPFTFTDLITRIGVWLRQAGRMHVHAAGFDAGGTERLRIDRTRRLLFVEGREVHITPLECKVLVALTGRPLTEKQLMAAVWGSSATRVSHYLHAQLRNLRRKVERDPSNPRYLVTEPSGRLRLRFAPA